MAKTAAKRKSEGDVPENSKRKRATAAATVTDDMDSSDRQALGGEHYVEQQAPVYVKKSHLKSRKSAPMHRHDDEYDYDEGRMESQQFLALVDYESKKKRRATKAANDFIEKFKSSIQSEEQALRERAEKLGVTATKEDNEFIEHFTRAYNASRPTEPPSSQTTHRSRPTSNTYFSTLYPRSQHLIASARSIVAQFDIVSEKTAQLDAGTSTSLLHNNWAAENESMAQLMLIGHTVGVQKVEALLEGAELPHVQDGDKDSVRMIYGEESGDPRVPWGRLAKKQLRAGKKLYRSTVVDETAV